MIRTSINFGVKFEWHSRLDAAFRRGLGLWAGPLMSQKLDLRHGDAASGRGTCHGATQYHPATCGAPCQWQRLITVPVTARGPTAPGRALTGAGTVRSDSGTQRQASLANLKPRPGAATIVTTRRIVSPLSGVTT
jgi:hypothetical protein